MRDGTLEASCKRNLKLQGKCGWVGLLRRTDVAVSVRGAVHLAASYTEPLPALLHGFNLIP